LSDEEQRFVVHLTIIHMQVFEIGIYYL